MGHAIGIDLGTTRGLACVAKGGTVRILPNSHHDELTPAVVSCGSVVGGQGEILVGRHAREAERLFPQDTVSSFRRLLGRPFQHADVERMRERCNCRIVESQHPVRGLAAVELGGKEFLPEDLAAMVLGEIKRGAEITLGGEVTDAVIAVPAHYVESQRAATLAAAKKAGLTVATLLAEPVAAALAFNEWTREAHGSLQLVFDLGGGSCDVSIVSMAGDECRLLDSSGDSFLGGDDFDDVIVQSILQDVRDHHDIDLSLDAGFRAFARAEAERAKLFLSSHQRASINMVGVGRVDGRDIHVQSEMSRADFETGIRPHVDRCMNLVHEALGRQCLSPDQIDDVLMVGGSTSVPLVRESMADVFGRDKLRFDVNPRQAVGFGAALVAARMRGGECPGCHAACEDSASRCSACGEPLAVVRTSSEGISVVEAAANDFGIQAVSGGDPFAFHILIPQGTEFPMQAPSTRTFHTAEANQERFRVQVFEGRSRDVRQNDAVGTVDVALPAGLPANHPLRLSLWLDRHGAIRAAVEVEGGACCEVSELARGATDLRDDQIPAHDDQIGAPTLGDRDARAALRVPGRRDESRLPNPSSQLDDDVEFTVYRPRVVNPQRWHTLLAFAHRSELPDDAPPDELDPIAEVRRQAVQILGADRIDQYKPSTQESRLAVPHAGELTMVPYLPGFECNPPRHAFLWQENVHRCEFRIRAGAHLDGQTVSGNLSVYLGSILVADVTLKVRVDSGHVDAEARPSAEKCGSRLYKKIFASYSHRDLVIVEQFEQLHRALGDRVLRDWIELRAGEEWNERLREMIVEADVFQLFWSRHAMQSPFVRQEYEFAVSLNRPSFVRPCYWEDPFPESPAGELPPPTLRRYHFHKLELTPSLPVERDARRPDAPSPPNSSAPEQRSPAAPRPAVDPQPSPPPSGSVPRPGRVALPSAETRRSSASERPSVVLVVGRAVVAAGSALARLIPRARPEGRISERLDSLRESHVLQQSGALLRSSEQSASGGNQGTVSRWLRGAGFGSDRSRRIVFAATCASSIACGTAGWTAASRTTDDPLLRTMAALSAGVAGAALPWTVVLWRRWRRRAEMRRFVHEAVPLLVMGARNGLGIPSLLRQLINDLEGTFPRAAAEWSIASHEMMLGCAVEDALRDLADRVELDEVERLTRAMRYAYRSGEPLEQALGMIAPHSLPPLPNDSRDAWTGLRPFRP